MRIAVLGLGEAGGAIATDLVTAGAQVIGYDPRPDAAGSVPRVASAAEAVAGADLVLTLTTAAAAMPVAVEAMPATRPGAVWADLNTSAPELKRDIAAVADQHGLRFADVALMAPVPGSGLATPALAAGPGADDYAQAIVRYGGRVTVIAGPPGAAAARKLLRSIVMKGLSTSIVEALSAARAAGCEAWLRDELAGQFGADLVRRLETGSHRHAARRAAEMAAAGHMLEELGVPGQMTEAARQWLAALAC